ncbi:MAG: glycosyltransferase family 2 protein [Selenomonadaceae bacterium]|nr:glycosyltransferase family 2 protein [Selenomonadaceae bacterium]
MTYQTPKISIVIPMYNAEKFIETTIDSVLIQTLEDFELILIDDRSTDGTLDLIHEKYSDPRIRLIPSAKRGHEWNARNLGLQLARGEYVYFVDHDDMLLPDALENLWKAVEKSDADSIHFNSYYTNINERFSLQEVQVVQFLDSIPPERFVPADLEWRLFQDEFTFSVMAWQKLIRRKFLLEHEIYFPSVWISSDSLHFFAELCLARKIFVINGCGYIYRQNPTNQMRTDSLKKLRYVTENFKPMLDFMEETFRKNLITPISRELQIRAEIDRVSLICMKFAAETYESGVPLEIIDSVLDEQILAGFMFDSKTISTLFHLAAIEQEGSE